MSIGWINYSAVTLRDNVRANKKIDGKKNNSFELRLLQKMADWFCKDVLLSRVVQAYKLFNSELVWLHISSNTVWDLIGQTRLGNILVEKP